MAPDARLRRRSSGSGAGRGASTASGQPVAGRTTSALTGLGVGALAAAGLGLMALVWGLPSSSRGEVRAHPADSSPSLMTAGKAVWAPAAVPLASPRWTNISCVSSNAASGHGGLCSMPRHSNGCARFVVDGAVPEDDILELRKLVEWLIGEAWGAGHGPPSVIDLHAGSISYKDSFVDLFALMDFKSINFTERQVAAYLSVRIALRRTLAEFFGIPEESVLHDMTFFSHINASKRAHTLHDEYWHLHTDTEQYGSFAYTTLLYLSTQGSDFQGGQFVFEGTSEGDADAAAVVEPRFGRIVAFTSGAEHPHRVQQVSNGVRMALTAAFTCNRRKATSIEPFPRLVPAAESGAASVSE